MSRKIVAVIIIALAFAGCCHTGKQPGLPQVLEGLEKDFADMREPSIPDFLSDEPITQTFVNRYVHDRQCLFQSRNPILLLTIDKLTLTLKGSISTEEGVSPGWPATSASFKVTHGTEQGFSWPLMPISLASLPDYYYLLRLKEFSEIQSPSQQPAASEDPNHLQALGQHNPTNSPRLLPTELERVMGPLLLNLLNEIRDEKTRLQERINGLQTNFRCEDCQDQQ